MFFGSIRLDSKSGTLNDNLIHRLDDFNWSHSNNSFFSWKNVDINILNNKPGLFNPDDYIYVNKQLNIIVFFDGKIYNNSEIEDGLGLEHKKYKVPHVLFYAYLKWGITFTNKLNGDFSIIVFEKKNDKGIFYRDHVGIHPFAISLKNEVIFFSSDPMGLCKTLYGDKNINSEYLLRYFKNTEYYSNVMPHNAVKKIKQGHYLKVCKNQITQKKYWHPEKIKTDNSLTQEKVLSDLEKLLVNSVNIRADIDVNASAHLSGGLDSGIVAAISRKKYKHQQNYYGFCWSPEDAKVYDDISHDERVLVNKTAKMHGIQPVYTSIDYDSYQNFFSDWRNPSEMMYEVKTIEAANARNINLIFSGWGGDDFISINNRSTDVDLIKNLHWRTFLKKYPLNNPIHLLRILFYKVFFPSLRSDFTTYISESPIYKYIKETIGPNKIPKNKRFTYSSRRRVHLQLLEMGHLQSRTSDWYVYGQPRGIEYRYPLLDKRVIEYMLKVPSRCLTGNNHHRIILREIGKNLLPQEVLKNTSKDDPLRSKKFYTMVKKIKTKLINEFEDFRNNPDLDFVDFALLEKNLPQIAKDVQHNKENDGSDILFYLKNAHEFTKGYYK